MNAEPRGARQGFLDRIFPERRIYIHSAAGTRHFTISPQRQALASLVLVGLVGWTGFTSVTTLGALVDETRTAARITALRSGYEGRLARMAAEREALERSLAAARAEREQLSAALGRKQQRLTAASTRLAEADAELAALRARLGALGEDRDRVEERLAARDGDIAALRRALVRAQARNARLDDALSQLSAEMEKVLAQRDDAREQVASLSAQVQHLGARLADLGDRHERLLSKLEQATHTSLAGLSKLFARTNVDIERLLGEARRDFTGRGGPYVPLDESAGTTPPDIAPEIDTAAFELDNVPPAGEGDIDVRVAALMKDLGTLDLMRYAAERMPFGAPVNTGRITSRFGPRRDPRNGRREMHEGLDIAAPRGTPIYATGDGVVAFVGWQHGYGRVVKIRHAFGFETVYAHLSRARVKRGQHVKRGDRIGDMGSTGRSTGNHVHYEVRINDRPVNPMKFIEAARDVL